MNISKKIEIRLKELGANFVHFIDITNLSEKENKKYPNAILFGIHLSVDYLQNVMNTPNYVQEMVRRNSDFSDDEFYLAEIKTGELADEISQLLNNSGYKAYSHSDKNQVETGFFDGIYGRTPLPHKTIARMSGIGWIGKNNLLVTPKLGSAMCLGVIITNAPLKITASNSIQSKCDNCNICIEVCEPKALKGIAWNLNTKREEMLDISKCTTCLNCMIFCPWTQNYIENKASTTF